MTQTMHASEWTGVSGEVIKFRSKRDYAEHVKADFGMTEPYKVETKSGFKPKKVESNSRKYLTMSVRPAFQYKRKELRELMAPHKNLQEPAPQ